MESEHIELDTIQEDLADEDISVDIINAPFSEQAESSTNTSNSSHCLRSLDQARTRSQNDIDETSSRGWSSNENEQSRPTTDEIFRVTDYCSLLAEQSDFLLFRRFKILNARVLLSWQQKLANFECQLADLDIRSANDQQPFETNYNNIMTESYKTLMEYYALANQVSEITERPNAHAEHIYSLNVAGSRYLNPQELGYLKYGLDLFALVPKFKNPLRKVFDKYEFHHWRIWRVRTCQTTGCDLESGKPKKVEIDDRLVDGVIKIVTMTIGLVMLIGPVWILEFIDSPVWKLSVISVFVVLFSFMMAYAIVGKPGDSLIAAAAYAAVLMVFLQLGSTS